MKALVEELKRRIQTKNSWGKKELERLLDEVLIDFLVAANKEVNNP